MRKGKAFIDRFTSSRIYLFILGLGATLWFLVRVIPKPSRATYPCMRAAAPLMSGFLIYIAGLSLSLFSFRKFYRAVRQSRHLVASAFLVLSLITFGWITLREKKDALALALGTYESTFPANPNEPLGIARGMQPGRVVWVHDPRATNENYVPVSGGADPWYTDNNANPGIIADMMELAIIRYAGTETIEEAWDTIFTSFNQTHDRGESGYTPGEKIAFKINLTNQSANSSERPLRMDATPQLLCAILDQLINVVGVDASDITMGDPYREFRTEYKAFVQNKFPGVNYVDGAGGGVVTQTQPSAEAVLKFSDGQYESTLPQQYLDATYVINIPCLKTHDEGGITLIAKNHQGSYLGLGDNPASQSAYIMHYSLAANSRGTGKYRHTVDYMSHEQTGGKSLIYIIDGIWAGESWQGWIGKFKMDPFNNDYPSSIFVGQDPVALESVGYDILFEEYTQDPNKTAYPILYKDEISDHLRQCASSDYWPETIIYDPEDDGVPIESQGVFEHWNNPTDREYSRNLGSGEGIELLYVNPLTEPDAIRESSAQILHQAAPNPFSELTVFSKPSNMGTAAVLRIYDSKGALCFSESFQDREQIVWKGRDGGDNSMPPGTYLFTIGEAGNHYSYYGKVVKK